MGYSDACRKELDMTEWLTLISQANEWKKYSSYFGKGVRISRSWATAHFLTFRSSVVEFVQVI